MNLLISWVAQNNDFENGEVNKVGPNYLYHKHFFNHDKHLILSSAKSDDTRTEKLVNVLKRDFKDHNTECEYMSVGDVIDVREIKTKIERILGKHASDEIDLFISPGTPAMQVAWYLCHTTMGLNTNLFQTRPAKFAKDKSKPELIKVDVETSSLPVTAILHQSSMEGNDEKTDYQITESIKPVYEKAEKIAQTDDVTVLILGESGTGKEHLAKYIHQNSIRKNKPYVTLNCSAFSDQLLESRLFGYKKGSFTGADKDAPGLFEEANGGTIFLDEIGDISSYMQQSLLRVLQEKEIMPIGGKAKKIDVRIITATNRNLPKHCEEGKFRWDLYYRLSVVELELPTLLQRGKEDLKAMIDFFITKKKQQLRKPKKLVFAKSAMDKLLSYSYPGNIRELENIIARLYVYHDEKIEAEHLPKGMIEHSTSQPLNWEHVEKEHIIKVLNLCKGNQRQTALAIGWALNTLKAKLKQYSIPVD
jgi:transcriptional regulator of acetoin/glycerol metabolism